MDFTQPWTFGDVTFILEDRKIYANKATLAMSSEVFNKMFTSEFAEKNMAEIELPHKKFDDFLELMQVLHPPNKTVNETNATPLFLLAHEYQIHHVIKQCVSVLLGQPPSIKNRVLADKFALTELRKVCINYAKELPYKTLTASEEFKEVNKETIIETFEHMLEKKEKTIDALICTMQSVYEEQAHCKSNHRNKRKKWDNY